MKVNYASRVVIEFVNNEAGLFLYTSGDSADLKIIVGGVSLNKAVVETMLVRALSQMVRNHLQTSRRKGVNREGEHRDRPIQLARKPAVLGGAKGGQRQLPPHGRNGVGPERGGAIPDDSPPLK